MPKRLVLVILMIMAAISLFTIPSFAETKVAVAIMPFKEGQLTNWGWDWNLAEGVTNLVIDEIVKRDKLNVVERTRVEELMAEQDLGDSGRIESETASQIGKLLGARLMVMGTITVFDFKQSGGIGFGPFRVAGSLAQVKLTGRVVDTQTGRVLGSFQGEGTKTGTSFSVDSYRGISLGGEQFEGSTLGQATYNAIRQYVDELIKVTDKVAVDVANELSNLEKNGQVLAVLAGDQIVIDLGSTHGIKLNGLLDISRLQTIKGLQKPVKVPIGQAMVISVEAEAAVAKVINKTQDIQEGDVVNIH